MIFDRLPKRWKTDDDDATERALAWLGDMVTVPLALVTSDGRAHCNAALNRALGTEVEADRRQLVDAIDRLAAVMGRSGSAAQGAGSIDERDLRLRTSGQRYVFEPVFAPLRHRLAGVIRVHRSDA